MPFEIPDNWEWCKITEIAETLLGKTLDRDKDKGNFVKYLCAVNVQWGKFDLSIQKQFRIEDKDMERYSVIKGDLLVCEGGDVGRSAIWENDCITFYQNALHRLRFKRDIKQYFYLYTLMYYKSKGYIDDVCKGVTIKHFTQNAMQSLWFPLPPLAEQQRIIVEVERWFALIEQIEQDKADLQVTIKQTKSKILDLAIHGKLVPQDPNDEPASELLKRINPKAEITSDNEHYENLPRTWCVNSLGDIFNHNTGKALNSSNQDGFMKEYLTTSNVYWNKFDLSVIKQMPFKENEINKYTVTKGDLLVCEGGDIGRAAIWNFNYDICIQNHLHRLRPKGSICVSFFYYALKQLKEKRLIGGKGIGLMGLSSRELHKILIPVPPLVEQERIVDRIESLYHVLNTIEESL